MVIASVFGFHYKQLVKRLENLETRFNKHDVDSANREVRLETLEKNLDKITEKLDTIVELLINERKSGS